jgi:hypothetical protein
MLDKHILNSDVRLEIRNAEYDFKEIKEKKMVALEDHLHELIYRKYSN